jgi:hypothetical protein
VPDCFAGVSGDFDGQGLSLGALQWNFGQGTLQPLLQEMYRENPTAMLRAMGDCLDPLLQALKEPMDRQMMWVRSIQDGQTHRLQTRWESAFRSLGRQKEFHLIQVKWAGGIFQAAKRAAEEFNLTTERGLALMFDIRVQNGSISPELKARIWKEIRALPYTLSQETFEVEKMKIIANRRAEAAHARWVEDVRARKLCIAEGKGRVHGVDYDLTTRFELTLRPWSLAVPAQAVA